MLTLEISYIKCRRLFAVSIWITLVHLMRILLLVLTKQASSRCLALALALGLVPESIPELLLALVLELALELVLESASKWALA